MTNLKKFLSQQHNDQPSVIPGESTESSETTDYYRVLIRLLADYTYIVSLEPESIVVEWVGESLAYATEYTHEELMCPGCWEKLIHPDDLPLLKGEQYHLTRLADSTVCEFRIVTKSGEVRWLVHHSSPIWDEKHHHIVKIIGAASDITERKRAEEALKEKQRFIERVAEASPDILYVDDLVEDRNIYINPQVIAILGYRPDELPRLQAERFRSLWPPNTDSLHAQWHRRLKDAQDGEVVEGEYQVRHANGEWRWLRSHSIVFSRTPDGAPHQILGTAQDITERKVAEEKLTQRTLELATLSQKLVRAQEDERRNIARELHDEIGQLLTGLSLTLETSKHLPPDKAKAKIDEGQLLLNTLIGQVRNLSLNLRPAGLDHLGLVPALLLHFERYTTITGIHINFHHMDVERRFPTEIETTVYRVVQEALTNVARHAAVGSASVDLWVHHGQLLIQVEDQGIGFDPEFPISENGSMGLGGMRERLALVGGTLKIEAGIGKGVRLTAKLPIDTVVNQANEFSQ
jgi:PAS domain S-box-containing protein